MKHALIGLAGLMTGCTAGCGALAMNSPLEVVDNVNLARYTGRWYEIARYPNWFEPADCVGTTAEYELRDDGTVTVINTCYEGELNGPQNRIEGIARIIDSQTNAKLKVRFFWPFEGDYWIIDLDDDYEWAVVGEPSRRFLWILSRTPALSSDTYEGILSRLPAKDYSPALLQLTPQPVADSLSE